MKRAIPLVLLLIFVIIGSLSGCKLTDLSTATPDSTVTTTSPSEDILPQLSGTPDATTTSATVSTTTTTSTPTETTPVIPPGSLALFATLSGATQTDFLRIDGGTVDWDTTHFKFLRYIPEARLMNEFGWTSSKSYSKSYIYGITTGEWVYTVKCFTDSGRKDVTRLDPVTGEVVATFTAFTTSDRYGGFTIYGDTIYYRTEITKDLLGNRKSGGDVMALTLGAVTAVEILDYYDPDTIGGYYAIGDKLITIAVTWEDGAWFYDIYRVDPVTLAVGSLLYSFGMEESVTFYEGSGALFWTEEDPTTGNTLIVRFPLDGQPYYFLEISESIPFNLSIDESNGKVLVTFQDNTPESPFYYLADAESGEVTELDIDPDFFSTLKYGNGQFLILE